jgi:hypothetical protein
LSAVDQTIFVSSLALLFCLFSLAADGGRCEMGRECHKKARQVTQSEKEKSFCPATEISRQRFDFLLVSVKEERRNE